MMTGALNIPRLFPVSVQSGRIASSIAFASRSRALGEGATDGGTNERRAFKSRAAFRAALRRAASASKPSMKPGFKASPDPLAGAAPDAVGAPLAGPGSVTVAPRDPADGAPLADVAPLDADAAGALGEDDPVDAVAADGAESAGVGTAVVI